MKKEQVLELMNAIPPDLIEEADVQAPAKRRRPSFIRTGLVAACLCLTLIGTTFAAVRCFWVEAYSGGEYAGYKVYGEFTKFPVDRFSPQLLADCEASNDRNVIRPGFDTWEEAKAYLGDGIPWVWPEQAFPLVVDEGQPPISLSLCLERENDDKLDAVIGFYTARHIDSETGRWIEPRVETYLATEYLSITEDENFGSMGGTYYGDSAYTVEQLEDYPMSNGAAAGIVRVGYPVRDGIDYHYIGNFVKDGIRYQVTTHSIGYSDSPEDIEADLKTILDLFP